MTSPHILCMGLRSARWGDPPGECHLSGRKLTNWPVTVPGDTTILHLDDNSLHYVPDGALLLLGNLEEISLQRNRFSAVRHNMFSGGEKLTNINLGSNKIMLVHASAFCKTSELVFLALDNNRLTFLYPETFLCLPRLRTLLLQYNSLAILEVPAAYSPPQSLSLAVHGNSLNCDQTRDSLSKTLLLVTLKCGKSTVRRKSDDVTANRSQEGTHF